MLMTMSLLLSICWAQGIKFLLFVSNVRICKCKRFSRACLSPCLYANHVVTFFRLKDLIFAIISQSICQPCQKRKTLILSGPNNPKLLLEYWDGFKTWRLQWKLLKPHFSFQWNLIFDFISTCNANFFHRWQSCKIRVQCNIPDLHNRAGSSIEFNHMYRRKLGWGMKQAKEWAKIIENWVGACAKAWRQKVRLWDQTPEML